ncbi:DUF927 domain-containing protein [Methylobacterium sp. WL116]|uniref:DUF927 domain-containing protein n=1 Tax=Methylobacterium sp. WL116 TaxID=2603889 RepID=UPI00164F481E|nr:DUF927 domain-containing protein [Methylobacterium sp. WL116]
MGGEWLRISFHGRIATAPIADLFDAEHQFFKRLYAQGVTIMQRAMRDHVKAEAERLLATEQVHVVETSGWQGSRFFRAGDALPAEIAGVPAIDARETTPARPPQGSFEAWQSEVRRLVNGQSLPTFVLACAFVPLLPRLVPELDDNPGFELFAETTVGKSVLLKLAASVHDSPAVLVRRWNTSINGLERPMAEANDGLLLLDEVSEYLEDGKADKRHTLARAMFKLAHGSEKARYDQPAARHRFAFLSTTNISLADVMQGLPPEEAAAIAVRVATIPAAASRYGVFDRLPSGYETGKAAAEALVGIAYAHYGHAARAFTAELERRMQTSLGRALLKRRIIRNLNAFRRRAGLHKAPPAVARAGDKFAMAYVAAHFACRWGILPLDRVGSRIMEVYQRHVVPPVTAAEPRTAVERIERYVAQHQSELIDIRSGTFLDLDDAALDAAPGFLASRRGQGKYLLLRTSRWDRTFGADSLALLREMKAVGRLWTNAGPRQCQAKLRANRAKDRVYAIRLDAPP